MAARRCTDCGINYPVRGHAICDGCGGTTDLVSNAKVSETWREDAANVKKRLEDAEAPTPPYPTLKVPVKTRDNLFFISSWDVCRAGVYQPLQAGAFLEISGKIYEVAGYSSSRREYWLELVENSPAVTEDLNPTWTGQLVLPNFFDSVGNDK